MNRDLYNRYIVKTRFPEWLCPNCKSGRLVLVEDTFNKTYRVDFDSSDPNFEPEWIEYLFTAHFSCTNERCSGKVVCSGSGGVDQFTDQETGEGHWEDYLCPKHFEPPLLMFAIGENVPRDVSLSLQDSFSLYFTSPQAALTKLRVTVETLLDELAVPAVSDKGKPLYLSSRIDLIEETHPKIYEAISALRWLGNAGAHADKTLHESNVLDGYQILKVVLDELYPEKGASLEELIAKVKEDFAPRK